MDVTGFGNGSFDESLGCVCRDEGTSLPEGSLMCRLVIKVECLLAPNRVKVTVTQQRSCLSGSTTTHGSQVRWTRNIDEADFRLGDEYAIPYVDDSQDNQPCYVSAPNTSDAIVSFHRKAA